MLTLEGGLDGAVSLKILGFSVSGGWTVKAFRCDLAGLLHIRYMTNDICDFCMQSVWP